MADPFVQWYGHKLWAHDLYCQEIATLTPERFTQDTWSSYPSIRDTMVHIFSADGRWLDRFRGEPPRAALQPADYPYLEDIRATWREIEEAQLAFVRQLSLGMAATITMPAENAQDSHVIPAWVPLYHAAHHAGYHRGQLATMLRQLGHRPPATDFLDYLVATR